jgi:ATP-dependent DNA helicase PIF1
VTLFGLHENMRIKTAALNQGVDSSQLNQFSDFLISIGEGKVPNVKTSIFTDEIQLPASIAKNMDENEIIKALYPNIEENYLDSDFMCNRAILSPKNVDVNRLNELASEYFPGEAKTYLSADTCINEYHQNRYPTEFLNTLIDSSLPLHKINLKLNQPVILIRNISQADGLCNGTKLIVRGLHRTILDTEVANGKNKGKRFFIPKFGITPSNSDLPISIKRVQFPIRSAFAMTINKSQGATLKKVGLFLNNPVFSHGQLYVALSRVASLEDIILATNSTIEGVTRNVVYKEVYEN